MKKKFKEYDGSQRLQYNLSLALTRLRGGPLNQELFWTAQLAVHLHLNYNQLSALRPLEITTIQHKPKPYIQSQSIQPKKTSEDALTHAKTPVVS